MSTSPEKQPLVRGGHPQQPRTEGPVTFTTSTPPVVYDNTIIIAAAAPNVSKGHPSRDGWLLSDFYAFNYLLRGLGCSQLWLTAADPKKLLQSDPAAPRTLLHGNAYRNRKVVLSQELINAGELTEPTVVRNTEMKDRFLCEVAKASTESYREQKTLLLLVFCHGMENGDLQLDCGDKRKGLSNQQLKSVLEPGSRVTLVTTACYSGGWTTTPDLNLTAATAVDASSQSNSWPFTASMSRACGSIFASALIEFLSGASSSLLDRADIAPSLAEGSLAEGSLAEGSLVKGIQALQVSCSLLPENPNKLQTETYNTFCSTIWDTLREKTARSWVKEIFSFSAKDDRWDDSWTGRIGMPLSYFEARWNKLVTVPYTGDQDLANTRDISQLNPSSTSGLTTTSYYTGTVATDAEELVSEMTACIHRRDIAGMAQLFLLTSPGDWNKSNTIYLNGMIRDFQQNRHHSPEEHEELAATIQYRWESSVLADHILHTLGLKAPNGQICILWNEVDWDIACERYLTVAERKQRWDSIFKPLFNGFRQLGPHEKQGYFDTRPQRYLTAALIQALKSEAETRALVDQILQFVRQAKAFYEQRAIESPEVRRTGREFLKSVGKRIRSLSPKKVIRKGSRSSVSSRRDRDPDSIGGD